MNTFDGLVKKSTLIYTTHSHHLINPLWLNGAYIVRNVSLNYEKELEFRTTDTDIEALPYKTFVGKYPTHRDYFQPILDVLDYQPGLLESIGGIVITEGKYDYYLLKYILMFYFNGEYEKLNFYPGGGANNNFFVIRLYLSWNRRFVILLDGDPPGTRAKSKYENEFGFELEGKIHTLNEICGISEAMEELFTQEEKLKICHEMDPSTEQYDKNKFHTGIQILLSGRRKISLSESTLKRFKTLFTYLDPIINE